MLEQFVLWLLGGTYSEISRTFLVLVSVILLARQIISWLRYNSTLPPGPWGVPIWGYLLFMKNSAHLHFHELAKKYGKIFSVHLGSKLHVVISDPRIIRDAFRRVEFSGRPHTDFMNIIDGYGIINTEGALWKDERKFLHEKLKSFGMTNVNSGMKNVNSNIMDEVVPFLDKLESKQGAPVDTSFFLALAISNVICKFTISVNFTTDDLRFKRFMKLIEDGFKLFASLGSANYIPWLRYFIPHRYQDTRNQISKNHAEMTKFHQEIIDHHKKTFDKEKIRDVTDAYIQEIQQAENENRSHRLFQGKNKDRQMQQILGDLFSAGMETVKTTLMWAQLFMVLNPDAAGAVQDELDQIVGRSRLPTLEDRSSLPITEATILEILRRSNLVPLGTAHATTRDVKFNGYTIPAGTHVIPLLYAVHMDPELWGDPEAFRPSRFLSDDGSVYKPDFFMPFGVGRRMCLGESLARMEIFLFFSCMMHKFNLSLPENAHLPSLRGNVGVTISPEPFHICFLKRDIIPVPVDAPSTPIRNIGSH